MPGEGQSGACKSLVGLGNATGGLVALPLLFLHAIHIGLKFSLKGETESWGISGFSS